MYLLIFKNNLLKKKIGLFTRASQISFNDKVTDGKIKYFENYCVKRIVQDQSL